MMFLSFKDNALSAMNKIDTARVKYELQEIGRSDLEEILNQRIKDY